MTERPNVFLRLSNGAENITLVRQALSGVAERLELAAGALNDIRTAATEACNNVALHAYSGEEGPLEVEIDCGAKSLVVAVRDHGTGIRPRIPARSENALGIGLAIIQTLAQRVEFNDPPGGGTEVRMEFPAMPGASLASLEGLRWAPAAPAPEVEKLAATTIVAIAPSLLAGSVLPRVLTALAARVGFTTDRISDVQLVADEVAAHAQGARGADEVRLTARVARRRIELSVGPLPDGAARELLGGSAGDGAGSVIRKLSDEQRIDGLPDGRESTVVLALADRT